MSLDTGSALRLSGITAEGKGDGRFGETGQDRAKVNREKQTGSGPAATRRKDKRGQQPYDELSANCPTETLPTSCSRKTIRPRSNVAPSPRRSSRPPSRDPDRQLRTPARPRESGGRSKSGRTNEGKARFRAGWTAERRKRPQIIEDCTQQDPKECLRKTRSLKCQQPEAIQPAPTRTPTNLRQNAATAGAGRRASAKPIPLYFRGTPPFRQVKR